MPFLPNLTAPRSGHLVWSENDDSPLRIELRQHSRDTDRKSGRFSVTYGVQVSQDLDYSAAARELGAAIMHAARCDGRFKGEGA